MPILWALRSPPTTLVLVVGVGDELGTAAMSWRRGVDHRADPLLVENLQDRLARVLRQVWSLAVL